MSILSLISKSEGEKKEKIFISYGSDLEKEKLERILSDMSENKELEIWSTGADTPASDELAKELEAMDTIAFISTPGLYTRDYSRTMHFDIPFAVLHDKGMTSVVRKEDRWLYTLDQRFMEMMASWYEKESTEQSILKAKAGAIGILLNEYEDIVPKKMTVPLSKRRLEIAHAVASNEDDIKVRVVELGALVNYAHAVAREGKLDEAVENLLEAYGMGEKINEEEELWESMSALVRSANLLGAIYARKQDGRKMKRWYRRSADWGKRMHEKKEWQGHELFASVDMYYTDSLLHLSALLEREGDLKGALEHLFTTDVTLKEHAEFVEPETLDKLGRRIDELAAHVLAGM